MDPFVSRMILLVACVAATVLHGADAYYNHGFFRWYRGLTALMTGLVGVAILQGIAWPGTTSWAAFPFVGAVLLMAISPAVQWKRWGRFKDKVLDRVVEEKAHDS